MPLVSLCASRECDDPRTTLTSNQGVNGIAFKCFFSAHCTGLCGVIIIFYVFFLVGGGHQVLHLNVISAVIIIIKLITFVVRQSKKES